MTNKLLGFLALIFFIVIASGLLWLAVQTDNAVSVLLSFAAGLSMIFLPCTLPLVFVILPLAAKEERPVRALFTAVAFAIGVSITIALYGIVTAFLGGYFELDQFTRTMFVFAGGIALIFALTELNLLRIPLPVFTHRIPAWLDKGYSKSFLLGLFLGNAGIGCPNPAFYVLLTYIASTGSAVTGGWLGLVHGLGRASPLIFLVLLTLLGMKSMQWISKVSSKVHLWTGFGLVIAGAFILTVGLVGMHWWEDSVFHAGWNKFVYNIAPNLAEEPNHPTREGFLIAPVSVGWWMLTLFTLIPIIWYKFKYGINAAKFWIIAALLLSLGFLASAGTLEVEDGHGIETEGNHIENHQQDESRAAVNKALASKFDYLNQHGNSSCSASFRDSIASKPDDARLQGSCCSPMSVHRYSEQVEGLKKYENIPEIPTDPYDIDAGLAKQLMRHYDMTLTPEEQKAYDYAMENSHEKGPCCCKCWRWYVYGGLGKLLIRQYGFTGEQITEVWNLSDGCGGNKDHMH